MNFYPMNCRECLPAPLAFEVVNIRMFTHVSLNAMRVRGCKITTCAGEHPIPALHEVHIGISWQACVPVGVL